MNIEGSCEHPHPGTCHPLRGSEIARHVKNSVTVVAHQQGTENTEHQSGCTWPSFYHLLHLDELGVSLSAVEEGHQVLLRQRLSARSKEHVLS